ncbi:MAG: methyltransferase domain-containing protein [Gemmatimonadota bacterium]
MSVTPDPLALNDAQIISSWRTNAAPWSAAVRRGEIESRRLVTDRVILDAILRRAPGRVLDIGCGEGWLSRALTEHGIEVIGIDAVPALVEAARAAMPQGDYRVASYEEVAAGALDVTVDLAVANFSLIGKDAVDALVRHVPSLLVPCGHFIVQTLHPATARGELPYRELPYRDGWRAGSWAGFSAAFTDPAPWYFRTLESWVSLLLDNALALQELREPVHPGSGQPASLLLVAQAV